MAEKTDLWHPCRVLSPGDFEALNDGDPPLDHLRWIQGTARSLIWRYESFERDVANAAQFQKYESSQSKERPSEAELYGSRMFHAAVQNLETGETQRENLVREVKRFLPRIRLRTLNLFHFHWNRRLPEKSAWVEELLRIEERANLKIVQCLEKQTHLTRDIKTGPKRAARSIADPRGEGEWNSIAFTRTEVAKVLGCRREHLKKELGKNSWMPPGTERKVYVCYTNMMLPWVKALKAIEAKKVKKDS